MTSCSTIVQCIETQVELFVKTNPILLLHYGVVVGLDLGVRGKSEHTERIKLYDKAEITRLEPTSNTNMPFLK